MSRRAVLVATAAAIVGAGVAAAVIARHDDGPAPVRPRAAPAGKATPVDNRIRLSHAESLRLVGWAQRLRTCMQRRGVALGEPVVHPKEIDLVFEHRPVRGSLERKVFACGDRLGEPPRDSSLQLRPGRLVLYLPRQCLLDPKVTSTGKSS